MRVTLAILAIALPTARSQGTNVWTPLFELSNPGDVIAASREPYNDNIQFAFADLANEKVEAIYTGGDSHASSIIEAEQPNSGFGTALATLRDSSGGMVLVGAPGYVDSEGGPVGAASVYRITVSEDADTGAVVSSTVARRGGVIVGGYDLKGVGDIGFGRAVSFIRWADLVVVCAPDDNTILEPGANAAPHGRCFVYRYQNLADDIYTDDWDWAKHPDAGTAYNAFIGDTGDRFGHAVSGDAVGLTLDGTQFEEFDFYFVAGSPGYDGGRGRVTVVGHNEDESNFQKINTIPLSGSGPIDACGTSVTSKADIVAFGCPGAGQLNNGIVRVYSLQLNKELGDGIVGLDGERLGEANSVSITDWTIIDDDDPAGGDKLINSLGLTVLSAAGVVRQYRFLDGGWVQMSGPYESGLSAARMAGGESWNPDAMGSTYVAVSGVGQYGERTSSVVEATFATEAPTEAPATGAPITSTPSLTPSGSPTASPSVSLVVPPASAGAVRNISYLFLGCLSLLLSCL